MKPRSDTGRVSIAFAMVLTLLAVAVSAGGWYWTHRSDDQPKKAPISDSEKPTFVSPDKNTWLNVPQGAMPGGTKVTFTPKPNEAARLNKTARGVTSAGTPVDIRVTHGSLAPNKVLVTLHYNPKLIPKGLTARQVGMVVFDPNLDAWVPILDAKVDAKRRTVTAIAPHFSLYDTVVLNPGKAVVRVGNQAVHTVIDAGTTVKDWFKTFARQLSTDLIKDLFAVAPKLSCNPRSTDVTATTKSLLNRLTACTEKTKSSDTTVRMRNGFAFPLRTQKLRGGLDLRFDDVWGNGDDLVNLVRNAYWAFQDETLVSGANLGSITATKDLRSSTAVLDVDVYAIPYDILLSALMAVAPEQSLAKDALKSAVKAAVKGGKMPKGKPGSASSWVSAVYDGFDCVVSAAHRPSAPKAFTPEGIKWAADVAHDCLSTVLSNLNLEGALADMLSFIKVIPEVLQSAAYGLFQTAKQQITQKDFDTISVTVKRDPFGAIKGTWYIGAVNVSVLTIDANGHGTIRFNAGPCDPDDHSLEAPICDTITDITFKSNGNGRFTGTYGDSHYALRFESGSPPAGSRPFTPFLIGTTFTMWKLGPDAIETDDAGPGNPYACRKGKWEDYSRCS